MEKFLAVELILDMISNLESEVEKLKSSMTCQHCNYTDMDKYGIIEYKQKLITQLNAVLEEVK